MTDSAARAAQMRDHYTHTGQDVSGLSDLDLVYRELDWQVAEATKLRDRAHQRMLDQNKHDANVRAAAESRAKERADEYARWAIQQRLSGARTLAHRAKQIGTRPSDDQLKGLRDAAMAVDDGLRQVRESEDDLYAGRQTDRERLQTLGHVIATLEAGSPTSVSDVLRLVRAAVEGGSLADVFEVADPALAA